MVHGVERFSVSLPRGSRRRRASSAASTATVQRRTRSPRAASTMTTTTTARAKPPTSKQRTASKLYNLEMDVVELAREIAQLRLHRSLLHTRALFTQRDLDGSAYKKAQQYFHVFRHGLRAQDTTAPAFLASIADNDLQLGVTDFKGRDVLVEQWRRYTAYFAIRKYEIHTMRVLATERNAQSCVVRGEGVFHGAFTQQALAIAFPSVLLDPWLTHELLGRELVTPVAFVLHFDAHGRLVRHDGEVDLFAALATTLGDYQRAAAIMERAVVAEEGMLDAPVDATPSVQRFETYVEYEEKEDDARERGRGVCYESGDARDEYSAVVAREESVEDTISIDDATSYSFQRSSARAENNLV